MKPPITQVNYSTKLNSGAMKPGEIKSDLQVFRLENRYVGALHLTGAQSELNRSSRSGINQI